MNAPARTGTTRSTTPRESSSFRQRHDHGTSGSGSTVAGGHWGDPHPRPGVPPIGPVLLSMSPSAGPEVSAAAYRSDRSRRHEGAVHHIALLGAARRVAGEERHRGVPRG